MPEINPLTNNQIFLKKIAENTGSDYDIGDVSEINPITIDQILLKEIAANTAGQSGDITELKEKVADNTSAIEATQDMISDAYDSTHTYNVGDYCIYENALYKCNTASTTGTWDSSKWDAVTVADELGELTEKVITIEYKELTSDGIGWINVPYDGRTIIATIGSGGSYGLVRDFNENHTVQRIQLYSCDPIADTWNVQKNETVTLGLVYLKD